MTLTTPDLKLSAYLVSLGFTIKSFYKLIYKDFNSEKESSCYQITFEDYNDEGESIEEETKKYKLPADKEPNYAELCYIIGYNLDAIKSAKQLYKKDYSNFALLSSKPQKDYRKFNVAEIDEDLALVCALNGKDIKLVTHCTEEEITPYSVANAYLSNLKVLTHCTKKEKLVLKVNEKIAIIDKNASEEVKAKMFKKLNS